jgi:hypothetical protein
VVVSTPPATAVAEIAASAVGSEVPQDPEASASEQAVATGEPVVVDADTTPTEQVTAQPDGTFQDSVSAEPTRMLRNGDWVDLDPTLAVNVQGQVVPKALPGSLTISNGGPAGSTIATFTDNGASYSVKSPWALPQPTLTGVDATFSDVLPGIDLVVQATTTGFSHNWVIKSRSAASDPEIQELQLPLVTPGLTAVKANGGTGYVDATGREQFWSPAPVMWDSGGGDATTSAAAVGSGPDQGDDVATVAATTDDQQLTLEPTTSMLQDPSTVFPVVLDPEVTHGNTGWTAVWDNFPNKSFWETAHSLGAGYEGYEQFKVVRSYFRFDTSKFAGKKILFAKMTVTQIWDASCSSRVTQLYRTGGISQSTTWNHQPSRDGLQDSNSSTVGCGGGSGSIGFETTAGVSTVANSAGSTATFMIRAKDESDKIAWKQFDSDAKLLVTYFSHPTTPTRVGFEIPGMTSPQCSTDSSSPTVINPAKKQITLHATVHDPDSGVNMKADFQRKGLTNDLFSTTIHPGDDGQVTWSNLSDGTYGFRAASQVSWGGVSGQYSAGSMTSDNKPSGSWCYVKLDSSQPDLPIIDLGTSFNPCDDSTGECDPAGTLGVGAPITVKDSSSDVVSFDLYVNGKFQKTYNDPGGALTTVNVTPTALMNTVKVTAHDAAGNGASNSVSFRVNTPGPAHAWNFDGNDATSLDLGSGVAVTPSGRMGSALHLAGTGTATTTASDVPTNGAFSVATWVRLGSAASATVFSAPAPLGGTAVQVGYDASTHAWQIASEPTGLPSVSAETGPIALPHAWTHLALAYDPGTHTLTLFVNGKPAASVVASAIPTSTTWWFGGGRTGTTPGSYLTGELDGVQLYTFGLLADDATNLSNPIDSNLNPLLAYGSDWQMADTTDDQNGLGLTVANVPDPAFVPADGISPEQALNLPGTMTQQVAAVQSPVDATGSFTINAWVFLADDTQPTVVAQQKGTSGPAWSLAYHPDPTNTNPAIGGHWVFSRTETDAAPGSAAQDTATFDVAPDTAGDNWNLLTASYDAGSDTIALYVNGQQGIDSSGFVVPPTPFTHAWQAYGQLSIGNGTEGSTTEPTNGLVTAFQGLSGAANLSDAGAIEAASWYETEQDIQP